MMFYVIYTGRPLADKEINLATTASGSAQVVPVPTVPICRATRYLPTLPT